MATAIVSADLLMMLLAFMTAPWQSGDTANSYHKTFWESDRCKAARGVPTLDALQSTEILVNCIVDVAKLAASQREALGVVPMLYVARQLAPTNEDVATVLASALASIGRVSEAYHVLASMFDRGGEVQFVTIFHFVDLAKRVKNQAPWPDLQATLQKVEQRVDQENADGIFKALLHHALATTHSKSDPSKAFFHTKQMNMHAMTSRYPLLRSKDEACNHFLDIAAAYRSLYFTADNLQRWQAELLSSDFYTAKKRRLRAKPLFIVGLPGSGTSLLESILDSHASVRGLGEAVSLRRVLRKMLRSNGTWIPAARIGASFFSKLLESVEEGLDARERQAIAKDAWSLQNYKEYCDRVAGGDGCANDFTSNLQEALPWAKREVQYIVTKHTQDFINVGAIRLLFPDSPIIHVSRDLRDVALSNLRKFFAASANIPWAFTWQDIVDHLQAYQQTMAHWNRVLPVLDSCTVSKTQCRSMPANTISSKLIHIRYEDLVQRPEITVRSLLQQLELSSTDDVIAGCLNVSDRPSHVPTLRTSDSQKLVVKNTSSWANLFEIASTEDQEYLRQLEILNNFGDNLLDK